MTRRALIVGDAATVARYLPSNYHVVPRLNTAEEVCIEGVDTAGWTLDGYVLPRLASGLMFGHEVAPVPETYVVVTGNCLWMDADATFWHAPLLRDGTVLWQDASEVEDWSGWADDEADRIRTALSALHFGVLN